MISGIEQIRKDRQKAVLEFITHEFDLDDAIKITEEDDYIITINEDRYYVIRPIEEDELMDEVNDDRFADAFENLSSEQRQYIDKDKWIEDHGLQEFTEYLEWELSEMPSKDVLYFGGFNFYLL